MHSGEVSLLTPREWNKTGAVDDSNTWVRLKKTCKSGVWSAVWRGKFATSVETFHDFITEGLHKADKNKIVDYKLDETVEENKTLQPSNTRNAKSAAVGSISL